MTRYRSRETGDEVNAVEYRDNNGCCSELYGLGLVPVQTVYRPGEQPILQLPTALGKVNVSPGDYVIKGLSGKMFSLKAEVFEQKYERTND